MVVYLWQAVSWRRYFHIVTYTTQELFAYAKVDPDLTSVTRVANPTDTCQQLEEACTRLAPPVAAAYSHTHT